MQLEKLKELDKSSVNKEFCRLMSVSKNGKLIATVSKDVNDNNKEIIQVYDTENERTMELYGIDYVGYNITSIALSGNGVAIVIGVEIDGKYTPEPRHEIHVYELEDYGIGLSGISSYELSNVIDITEGESDKTSVNIRHISISDDGFVIAACISKNKVSIFRKILHTFCIGLEAYIRDDKYFYNEHMPYLNTAISSSGDRLIINGNLPLNAKYKDSEGNPLPYVKSIVVYKYNYKLKKYVEEANLFDNEANIRIFGSSLAISDDELNIVALSLKFDKTGTYAANVLYVYSKRGKKWKREIKAPFNRNDLEGISISANGSSILINRIDGKDVYILTRDKSRNYTASALMDVESSNLPFTYNDFKCIMPSNDKSLILLFNKDVSGKPETDNKDIVLRELYRYSI